MGCENNANNISRTLIVKDNEEQFKQCARLFVHKAIIGDLEGMLSMTSDITKNHSGLQKVKEVYKIRVIPEFSGTIVSWDSDSKLVFDEGNNAGFLFHGKSKGKKDFQFSVSVFGEGGNYVVGSIIR